MNEAVKDAERARKQFAILEAERQAEVETREQVERDLKGEGGRRERIALMLRTARGMLAEKTMLHSRQKLLHDSFSGMRASTRLSRSLNRRMLRVMKLRRSSTVALGFKAWKDRWNANMRRCDKLQLYQAAKARRRMYETFFKMRKVCSVLRQSHRYKAQAVATLLRMLVLRSFRTWRATAGEAAHYRRVVGKVMNVWAKGSLSQYFGRWRDVSIQAKRVSAGPVMDAFDPFMMYAAWRSNVVFVVASIYFCNGSDIYGAGSEQDRESAGDLDQPLRF